jgi:hypothetical protein
MGKKKLVNEFFWISYILFFGMYLTKLKSNFVGFHQSQLQAILPKKGSHFEKKKMKKL